MNRKSPASLGCENRASYSLSKIEYNPRSLAEQKISQRFGLTPTLAALVAHLAGIGPKEARA